MKRATALVSLALSFTSSFVTSLRVNSLSSHRHSFSLQSFSSFDLLMDTPVVLRGVADIVDRYDIFLLDQFGVLHDGVAPLPGVLDTLNMLKEKNKKTVILSNTSSRSKLAQIKYKKMGFPDYDITFVTSGEFAWNYIDQNFRGKKCTWITWSSHANDDYLATLDVTAEPVESADFLLFHGTQTVVGGGDLHSTKTTQDISRESELSSFDGGIDLYNTGVIDEPLRRIIRIAIERGIPSVCANMDQSAMSNKKLRYMPGMLMDEYRRMGGTVHCFGKPMVEYFELAIEEGKTGIYADTTRRRILHVGDSVHHDLKGAHNAKIDCLLVTANGVHIDVLGDVEEETEGPRIEDHCGQVQGQPPLLMRVTDLCDRVGVKRPLYVIRNFEC
jgi:ribonucleotide monophosphatase NagD (HAD superfamily)